VWESGQSKQRIFVWQTSREILPGKPVLRWKDILEVIISNISFHLAAPTMECKRQAKRKKKIMILFLLNNELTWKKDCADVQFTL